ncbi:MAG: bifunctional [glutamine synthetase] adenylyltransferase/[glutamine synthetase]-adenylyl-L-tyrosine phosphorylase [Rhizobiales bacterium]|nr:bifunctional [glutamine synthetase] adenylyltransferase/[glutamine synthetase]-adenylyl-L-tyrosine phosphorylase [Hyphomicrobiales bacterium]
MSARTKPGPAASTTLAQRIASAPELAAPKDARKQVRDWLSALGADAGDAALKALLSDNPKVVWLMTGLADGSPYLWGLAREDSDRLVRVLLSDPDDRLRRLLGESAAAMTKTQAEAEAMRLLRLMKAEAVLMIALCDIGGVWPVAQVTRALTELADTAVRSAVRFLLAEAARRGTLRPRDPADPEAGSGYIVLAMGKMGAFELNFSSDIDLIVFFDPDAAPLPPNAEPMPLFVRVTRGLVKLLQERTADGYVFRVDLRLRPDPASTQIAISTPAAINYYESTGQNWERQAMIKARQCAGDFAAGEALLKELSPFVWRKYLDFAAVADVQAIKRQIHAYKGFGEIAIEGHNIKLGRGGIREIEFFVQTQQLIAGGRHPELRGRDTLAMLDKLVEGGWVDAKARDSLTQAYQFLRVIEHRLQMVADEQTHILPDDRESLDRFANFAGFNDRDAFADVLVPHLCAVQQHYAQLFEQPATAESEQAALVFPVDTDSRETLDALGAMGFRRPLEASATVRAWFAGGYRSLQSEFAREQLRELVPLLLEHLSRTDNPDDALARFDRFLSGLRASGRLLSLLRQNPDVVAFLALILSAAPRLGDSLAQQPQVMDTLIDPSFFGALPDENKLTADLQESLRQASALEDFLDRVRLFGQEHMFLIGARILSGTVSAAQAGATFARLADVLIRALHRAVEESFAEAHGRIRGGEAAVLAMGKLGGREMTATSDLDLIIVYDFDEEHPESDGRRPLYGSQYFARLTQRLINALTAQTNYGVLYQVDMRLRPSGRSGPVAAALRSFENYQLHEAWTWEQLALTRARVVSASPGFAKRIEEVIRKALCRPRDRTLIAGDVVEMRQAIATEKGDSDRWNLRYAAGGLVDIEFIAQYLQLVHAAEMPGILDTATIGALDKAWQLGLLAAEDAEILRYAARLHHSLTQVLRVCWPEDFDPKQARPELLGLLTRAADVPNFAALDAHLTDTQERVRASFVRILSGTSRVG